MDAQTLAAVAAAVERRLREAERRCACCAYCREAGLRAFLDEMRQRLVEARQAEEAL